MAAIAIPIASRVSSKAKALVKERPDYLDRQTTADNEDADDKHSKDSKAAVGEGVAPLQDILYDRRSQYWDKRVLRRLERQDEYLDEQDDNKDTDAKDSKAAKDKDKNSKDAADDDEDFADDNDKELERRPEYWRKRLDRDW